MAATTLDSALLGARKGDIEWALVKTVTAMRTLKKAARFRGPLNADSSDPRKEKL